MHALVAAETAKLSTSIRPVKTFAEVERFLAYFRGQALHRRPMLAIVGATNLGKSMVAAAVIRKVGKLVGADGFLEITVQQSEHLDLSDFDPRQHGGLLLDGVGDAMTLHAHREVLQGRPKLCKGGASATMMYAYPYALCNRAVVATFDLSAKNLGAFVQDHWLSSTDNVIPLFLTGKAFEEPRPEDVPVPFADGRTPPATPPNSRFHNPVTGTPALKRSCA